MLQLASHESVSTSIKTGICFGNIFESETQPVLTQPVNSWQLPFSTETKTPLNRNSSSIISSHIYYAFRTLYCRNMKQTWYSEVKELFPTIRDFTDAEAENYKRSLLSIFKPTGRNYSEL